MVTQVERRKKYTVFPEDVPIDLSSLCGRGTGYADKVPLEIEDKGWKILESKRSLVDATRQQSQELVIE